MPSEAPRRLSLIFILVGLILGRRDPDSRHAAMQVRSLRPALRRRGGPPPRPSGPRPVRLLAVPERAPRGPQPLR